MQSIFFYVLPSYWAYLGLFRIFWLCLKREAKLENVRMTLLSWNQIHWEHRPIYSKIYWWFERETKKMKHYAIKSWCASACSLDISNFTVEIEKVITFSAFLGIVEQIYSCTTTDSKKCLTSMLHGKDRLFYYMHWLSLFYFSYSSVRSNGRFIFSSTSFWFWCPFYSI